jgi:hypothetical protein
MLQETDASREPVADICNPRQLLRRQRSGGSQFMASGANSSRDPVSKIPITKRAGRVAQGEDLEFKPQ